VVTLSETSKAQRTGTNFPINGHLYSWKVAKNSGQCDFLSACEIEHGRFRALFAGMFLPKMQSALSQDENQHQKRFTAKGAENAKE
jgi:hypothetical protein